MKGKSIGERIGGYFGNFVIWDAELSLVGRGQKFSREMQFQWAKENSRGFPVSRCALCG